MTTRQNQPDEVRSRPTIRSSELMRRWLEIVRAQIPAAATQDDFVLLGDLPDLVALLQQAPGPPGTVTETPGLREAAQTHGARRAVLAGYPLAALLQEFSILSALLVEDLHPTERRSSRARDFLREQVDLVVRWAAAAFVDIRWETPLRGAAAPQPEAADPLQGLRKVAPVLEEAVLLLDVEAKVQSVNPAALALFGVGTAELQRMDLHDVLHGRGVPPHAREACPLVAAVRSRLSDDCIRLTVARPDGLSIPVLCSLVDLGAETGAALVCRLAVARHWEQDLILGQHRILELIARGEPLASILENLARLIERLAPGVLCSILLVDEQGRLQIGAAPSLPEEYNRSLEGLEVGPEVGSCGAAAARGEPVITVDIGEDVRWGALQEVAGRHHLRACWSMPILSSTGAVLGTFAMYYREPGEPSDWEMHLIEAAAHAASIAIERVRAAEALRSSEDRYRTLLSNIPGAVYRCHSPDWHVSFVTEFIEEITGYPASEFVDGGELSVRKLIHPEDRPRVILAVENAIVQRTPYILEYRIEHARAGLRWVYDKGRPVYDQAGQVLFLDGVLIDITDQKHLEEELQRRAQDLAEGDRRKNEFLAMLAHELRNPLAPILTAVHVIRLHSQGDELLARAGDVVERQVLQMRRLVDDLLDVARITRGTIEIRRERVDLVTIIQNAVQTVLPFVQSRGHLLRLSFPPYPLWVLADPTRMEQVFTNLLNNAAKFTNPGGILTISAAAEEDWAVVRVRDTGKGIPPEMLPHIFELFTQVNPSIDRSQGGLGLGLTLVRSLVVMHGGEVQAYSAGLGQGSEFAVRLPLLAGDARQTEAVADGHRVAVEGCTRVLVVDDNLDAAETMAELLQYWGYAVRTAHDGPAALRAAFEFRPHVILLDVGLPGLDGYEVVRRIRANEVLKDTRVFALTGYGQASDRQRALQSGFDEHLVKPVSPDQLQRLLQEHFREGGASG